MGTVAGYLAPCFHCKERAVSMAKYDFEMPDKFVDLDDAGGYLFHHDCLICTSAACPFNHFVQKESDDAS